MTPLTARTATAPGLAYTPSTSRAALNAECLRSILAGLPLPEAVRPPVTPAPRPATARQGIEWMVSGGAFGGRQ